VAVSAVVNVRARQRVGAPIGIRPGQRVGRRGRDKRRRVVPGVVGDAERAAEGGDRTREERRARALR